MVKGRHKGLRLHKTASLGCKVALACAVIVAGLCGCATRPPALATRHFDFSQDTFAYPNELIWEYHYDAKGNWTTETRKPKPDYAQHCFVLARAALLFFRNARFAPEAPVADEA